MLYDDAKRYFHRMNMTKILARIQKRIADLGTTESAVSKKAKRSADTIRNWRRGVEGGGNPGASVVTLQPIADALDVPLDWLLGNGPDSLDDYLGSGDDREKLLRAYERLSASDRARALKIVSALGPSEDEEPS